jgi:acyl dehydratase
LRALCTTSKEKKMATIEDMKALVGTVLGTSDWVLIDQDMINKFADATGDHQFIHIDVERAKLTPFGQTIAHGFLTLSLLPKLRFLSPVKSGKRVRGVFKLASFEEKRPGQIQQTQEVTVEIEGEDKPALICEWISQTFV